MTPPHLSKTMENVCVWGAARWHLTTTTLSIVYGFQYIVTLGKIDEDPT